MDPQLVVVIPCHDEPDVLETLNALWRCERADCVVEVVLVINGSEEDISEVKQRNHATQIEVKQWIEDHKDPRLCFYSLFELELSSRLSGVGTARKIGMDWACSRFSDKEKKSGVIVCLDADCGVANNYLKSIYSHFQNHPLSPGCSIHFEHPLENLSSHQRQGIICYELYLRYYRQGLRWSGFPYAYHTVGSSMAVRAGDYSRQGGMNRRKAGEDFYFLQKIIPLGGFTELLDTKVYPSARVSHRVPFGTGRAMLGCMTGKSDPCLVYDPRVFQALSSLFSQVDALYSRSDSVIDTVPDSMQTFLKERKFLDRFQEIRSNTKTLTSFRKRFFQGFNGFQVLKYVHFATEHTWPKIAIHHASVTLLSWMGQPHSECETESLLSVFRQLDRTGYGTHKIK